MSRVYPHTLSKVRPKQLGLVVLQSDETIEPDFRRLLPDDVELLVSRVPSAETVSAGSLKEMEAHLSDAASLFPRGAEFSAIGYACTSGASQIGQARVARLIEGAVATPRVTDPVTALVAACEHLSISRLALLSPYVAEVSDHLRRIIERHGVETPVFGSFDVAEEARVVRISTASILDAATELLDGAEVDGVFLSCTNLRTLDAIDALEQQAGLPVLSSNQVLAWHMLRHAGVKAGKAAPGRLFS